MVRHRDVLDGSCAGLGARLIGYFIHGDLGREENTPVSIPLTPFDNWLDNVALGALSSRETLKASYDLARLVIENGVPGDFVECGVFGGAQCAAMARAICDEYAIGQSASLATSFPRRIHLFDTFAGIPEAGPEDIEFLSEKHKAGLSACSLQGVKDHMAEWGIPPELLVYHPGDFETTMQDARNPWDVRSDGKGAYIHTIALLRLDGDLYRSTKVCLDHLLPLVSPGGWVIVDDFGLTGARQAVLESGLAQIPAYFQKQRA